MVLVAISLIFIPKFVALLRRTTDVWTKDAGSAAIRSTSHRAKSSENSGGEGNTNPRGSGSSSTAGWLMRLKPGYKRGSAKVRPVQSAVDTPDITILSVMPLAESVHSSTASLAADHESASSGLSTVPTTVFVHGK